MAMEDKDGLCLEWEDFGEEIGSVQMYQFSTEYFHRECHSGSSSSHSSDSTGKRLYAGARVAIRFFLRMRSLLEYRSVIEVGCGIGVVGSTLSRLVPLKNIVLTDGNSETLEITKKNIELAGNMEHLSCRCLTWEEVDDFNHPSPAVHSLLQDFNRGQHFDVAIGCELMYFSTEVATLMSTVVQLCGQGGIFMHAHLFRKSGQITELVEVGQKYGWITVEVVHESFISERDLGHHPEWFRMRALLSGSNAVITQALSTFSALDPQFKWKPLVEYDIETSGEDRSELSALFGS